jgi:hypothetical protein
MRSLVYLSPVPWASVAQRPHKFVEWFHATHGGPVLWIDPYPSRLPRWTDVRRALERSIPEPGPSVPDFLQLVRVPAVPLEPVPGLASLNRLFWRDVPGIVQAHLRARDSVLVIGKPSRLAMQLLRMVDSPARAIYDCMDDFPAFHGGLAGRTMSNVEQRIVARADAVYASSGRLQDKIASLGRTATLVRNACDPASLPSLSEVARLREPDLVGYVGTLASWFDWSLVARIGRARPDMRFRLIGPRHVDIPADLPPNVEVRPPCAHAEAMREMARFSVGLIPFRRNTLTDAVDPVKYYEYRALGIPVVSSPFGEMPAHAADDRGVALTQTEQDSVQALEGALAWVESAQQVERFRTANSWSARFSAAEAATSERGVQV